MAIIPYVSNYFKANVSYKLHTIFCRNRTIGKKVLTTFIVDSSPGVGANQQSGSKRLAHHVRVLLTDDLDVSGQETDISRQSVREGCSRDRVSLTWAETEEQRSVFQYLRMSHF